jgi:hypothetical protein
MATINFNDKIFIQDALQAFTATLLPLNAFSRSYSAETRRKGDALAIPRVDPLSTTTFSYDNNSGYPYESLGGTINTITLSLDKHQIVGVDLTDIQVANSSAAEISAFARQQGKALGLKVLQDVFGLMSIANYGAAVVTPASIADIGRLTMSSARTAMVKRNIPVNNVNSLVVNADIYQNLVNDANISQSFQYGGSEAIREARVPRLLGMDVYETNVLPLGGTLSLVGFLAHPDALAVAVRTLQPQDTGAYLSVETAVDDETGLAFTYRRHFNPGRGRHFASLECLFGFTTALTLGLGLLRRAD